MLLTRNDVSALPILSVQVLVAGSKAPERSVPEPFQSPATGTLVGSNRFQFKASWGNPGSGDNLGRSSDCRRSDGRSPVGGDVSRTVGRGHAVRTERFLL